MMGAFAVADKAAQWKQSVVFREDAGEPMWLAMGTVLFPLASYDYGAMPPHP